MKDETINRGVYRAGLAVVCGLLFCAGASGQASQQAQLKSLPDAAQPAVAAAKPATGRAAMGASGPVAMPMENMFFKMPAAGTVPHADSPEAKAEEDAAANNQDGRIKVHGHWVIEVKRKDGTVRDRREFDNSYIGGYLMGLYLAGFDMPIDPAIDFTSSTNGAGSVCNGLNNPGGGANNECLILSSLTAGHGAVDIANGYCVAAGACYGGLTNSLTPDGSGGYSSLVLNGTITSALSGTFDTVGTSFGGCYNAFFDSQSLVSPNACYTNAVALNSDTATTGPYYTNGAFTSTKLGSAVVVTAGEVIVFTVTYTFS